ncbi:polysaccharide biosynthesis tyrosine autokinase [candidate division KSB1 bacterium]|nr:polysaccharide biosynthesis tyrosine autokinase [candidate division KSB1 bacterium]
MESVFLDEEELQDEKIDIRRYLKAVLRRWWVVLIVTIAVTVPWVLYTFSKPAEYEAQAVVQFNSFEGNDPTLTESRETVLTSRSFAEKVVAQMGLSLAIESDGKNQISRLSLFSQVSTTQNPIPGEYLLRFNENYSYRLSMMLDEDREKVISEGLISDISEKALSVNGFSIRLARNYSRNPQDITFTIYPFRDAVKNFRSKTGTEWNRSGNLMTITLTDEDPDLAAKMTNRLAEIFVEKSASLKTSDIKKRSELLEEQVNLAKSNLDEADRALKEFKENNAIDLNAEQQTQVNQLVVEEQQTRNLESYKNTLESLLAKLDDELLSGNGNSATTGNRRYIFSQLAEHAYFDNNSTMLIYRQKLKDETENRRTIVASSSEQNPRAISFDIEIRQTQAQIEDLARREIRLIAAEIRRLNRKIQLLRFNISRLPAQQQRLGELTRDQQVLEKQYLDLLTQFRDAQISKAVESEEIEVLDPAIVPEFPKNLNKKMQASMGGVFGLGLGIFFVILLEFFDKSVKTVNDVKRFLKLPVMGTIPLLDFSDVFDFQDSEKLKQIDQQLVTHDYSPTPIGEAYRSLRTNLLFSKDHGKIQSLVATSTEPGDGKSFTTANLAITFAQLKTNTLLIDGDLRRGVLHNTFGLPKEPGFSNYLTRMVPLQSILYETHIPNLTLITCGSLIPNPSELLGSQQMRKFLDEARRKYELIIFDSPPLNAATDAVVIGTQVDSAVMVIRAGKTNREFANQKLELFSNVPAKVLGVILNGTTSDMAHPGYSYYHY